MSIQKKSQPLVVSHSAKRKNAVRSGWIQVRATDEFKDEAKTVADLRGLSVSALVHFLLKQAIREEKERDPSAFQRKHTPFPQPVDVAIIEPDSIETENISEVNKLPRKRR